MNTTRIVLLSQKLKPVIVDILKLEYVAEETHGNGKTLNFS